MNDRRQRNLGRAVVAGLLAGIVAAAGSPHNVAATDPGGRGAGDRARLAPDRRPPRRLRGELA
jgi:hypothetical protein